MLPFPTTCRMKIKFLLPLWALITSCQLAPLTKPTEQNSATLESDRDPSVPQSEVEGLTFDFCPSQRGFSLTHALWMTYFSALEYAHFSIAAPELQRLGFGKKEDSESWVKAWYDLRIKRIIENTKNTDDTWNNETERLQKLDELKLEYDKKFGETYVDRGQDSKTYEHDLVSGKNPSKSIQFLSSFLATGGTPTKGATQAVYTEHSTLPLALILLRGSEVDEPRDLAADINILHTSLGDKGNVHRGFYQHTLDIWPALEKTLKERSALLESQNKKIHLWIGGHSLGGAAATLLAGMIMDLKESGAIPALELTAVYSMGSPRVGNRRFVESLHAQAAKQNVAIYRIRNGRDLVTGLPVSGPLGGEGYRHAGALVYITQSGEIAYGDGNQMIETSTDYVQTRTDSFRDHQVRAYWSRMKTIYLKQNPPQAPQGCSLGLGEALKPFIEYHVPQEPQTDPLFHL